MPLKDATGATDSTSMTTNMMCLDDVRVPRADLHSSCSLPSTPYTIDSLPSTPYTKNDNHVDDVGEIVIVDV